MEKINSVAPATEFKNMLATVSLFEKPDFKTPPPGQKLVYTFIYSAYASLLDAVVRTKPELFDEKEKEQIERVTRDLITLQEIVNKTHIIITGFSKLPDRGIAAAQMSQSLQELTRGIVGWIGQSGGFVMPAGSLTHSVILEIQPKGKGGNESAILKYYNAGYGVSFESSGKSIYTHEARPKSQPAVAGLEVYRCEGLQNIANVIYNTLFG